MKYFLRDGQTDKKSELVLIHILLNVCTTGAVHDDLAIFWLEPNVISKKS